MIHTAGGEVMTFDNMGAKPQHSVVENKAQHWSRASSRGAERWAALMARSACPLETVSQLSSQVRARNSWPSMAKGQAPQYSAWGHSGGQRWHNPSQTPGVLSWMKVERKCTWEHEHRELVQQGLHGLRTRSHSAWLKGDLRWKHLQKKISPVQLDGLVLLSSMQ